MSNSVFPMPAPPSGSWAWPVKKRPLFKTIVQTPASNRGESRISLTPNPLYMFEYDFSYLKGDFQTIPSAIANLAGFFNLVRGASEDWLFQDPYDNVVAGQLLGYGDSLTTQFQIGRSLFGGAFEIMQNVFPTALKINGVSVPAAPQPSGNQWYCGLENLLLYSQDFETASVWLTATATISADSITAPDGTSTADAITFPGTGTGQYIGQSVFPPPGLAGQPFTLSVWLKVPSGTPSLSLIVEDGGFGSRPIISQAFTLSTSWQRFSISGVTSPFTSQLSVFVYNPSASGVYHVWGAQLERWTSPTSYVATTNNAPVFPRGVASFAIAPASQLPVTADFSYYYRCRFEEDEFQDLEEFLYQIWSLKSMKFRSIIL